MYFTWSALCYMYFPCNIFFSIKCCSIPSYSKFMFAFWSGNKKMILSLGKKMNPAQHDQNLDSSSFHDNNVWEKIFHWMFYLNTPLFISPWNCNWSLKLLIEYNFKQKKSGDPISINSVWQATWSIFVAQHKFRDNSWRGTVISWYPSMMSENFASSMQDRTSPKECDRL